MTNGPARLRLDAALAQADEGVVTSNGSAEWANAAARLQYVSEALRTAADSGLGIGGETGPAMFKAMHRSAKNLDDRISLFLEGKAALDSAATTIEQVRKQRDQIDTNPDTAALPDPGSFSDDPEWDEEKRMTEQGKHNAAVTAFQEREALREQRAREIAEQFDRRYDEPIAVMKKIHGIPDPEPADGPGGPGGGQGPGGRTPIPRGTGGGLTGGPTIDGGDTDQPDRGDGPITDGPENSDPQTQGPEIQGPEIQGPQIEGPPIGGPTGPTGPVLTGPGGGGLAGTIGTGVGIGLGGGALLGGISKGVGLVRGLGGGLLAGGQQTRPLGGLSRSAVSGTLGRGSAAGAPVSGRPAGRGGVGAAAAAGRTGGARAGGTAGAAGAGGRGGSRTGAAGGRAGAGAAGGSGRGRSRDRRADSESYDDDGSDWLDDEAAPGVLG